MKYYEINLARDKGITINAKNAGNKAIEDAISKGKENKVSTIISLFDDLISVTKAIEDTNPCCDEELSFIFNQLKTYWKTGAFNYQNILRYD